MQYIDIKNTGRTVTECDKISLFLERMQSNLNPQIVTGLNFQVKNGYIVNAFYTTTNNPENDNTYYNQVK